MADAVIVAAGKGVRMNSQTPKQYLDLGGLPLLSRTLQAFDGCVSIDKMILVVPDGDIGFCAEKIIGPAGIKKKITPVAGGLERQDSVYNGLLAVDDRKSVVLIHDGVRPFVSSSVIEECVHMANLHGACIAGIPASDTIKSADDSGFIKKTLERDYIWLAQTPQAFDYSLIKRAHEQARKEGFTGTDDASLVERLGEKVKIIRGSSNNIKITTKEDLELARAMISADVKTI
jgi:2-C-methyl-D-erythritol 4-phosphate cytidylyltransferase